MPININYQESPAQLFLRLRVHDPNLNNEKLVSTINFSFNSTTTVVDLLKNETINFDGIEWDFELVNGIRSLVRRGFYKIVGEPFEEEVWDRINGEMIPVWTAEVLFCPHDDHHHKYFKFKAHVGSLVNKQAVGLDARAASIKVITSSTTPSKKAFFTSIKDKVLYVSQQRNVNNLKETVWFIFK